MAVLVTITDSLIALPFAFYLAKVAGGAGAPVALVAAHAAVGQLPGQGLRLGSTSFQQGRPARPGVAPALPTHPLAFTNVAMWIVFELPLAALHIVPIDGAFERVPTPARRPPLTWARAPGRPFAGLILPMVLPGIVAGSIFTFSLTLGDFITPR